MFGRLHTLSIVPIGAVIVVAACARGPETLTPEAAHARGDALLKEMSTNLAALQTFAYTADEVRLNVSGGSKVEKRVTRRVVIRRPSALTFTSTSETGDSIVWYDGKHVTLVSSKDKVWARGPMPSTLDEALDFISAEYAIQMPTADLLYSSPYEALMTPDTTGGWVDVQTITGRSCDHLAYQQPVVDWEIWLSADRRLPCQAKIRYKNDAGQPSTTVTFTDLDLSPKITDETFAATVPEGYQRIKIMRHATIDDPSVAATESAPDKPTKK